MEKRDGGSRFRPGFVFKDGKAYEFERDRLTVMRPWPAPAAWRLTAKARSFRHVLPRLNLGQIGVWAHPEFVEETVRGVLGDGTTRDPEREERLRHGFGARNAAARAFMNEIPAPVRKMVTRFRCSQWQMLTFLGRVPDGLELASTNPILAWALALNPTFHRPRVSQPLRAARTWSVKPRRRIAGWLGFPETDASVRLLAKVDPHAAKAVPIFTLRQIMRDGGPRLRTLQHLPRIHGAALACVGRHSFYRLVTGPFIGELARLAPEEAMERLFLLRDTRRMADGLDVTGLTVHSLAQLTRVHDELVERHNRDTPRARRDLLVFPAPPIAGTAAIEPIATPEELEREGREMQHCVASYGDSVASGQAYVYRVHEPERATLSIEPDYRGTWRLTQLKAIRNLPVEPETKDAVARWLAGEPEPEPPIDLTPMFPQFMEDALCRSA